MSAWSPFDGAASPAPAAVAPVVTPAMAMRSAAPTLPAAGSVSGAGAGGGRLAAPPAGTGAHSAVHSHGSFNPFEAAGAPGTHPAMTKGAAVADLAGLEFGHGAKISTLDMRGGPGARAAAAAATAPA